MFSSVLFRKLFVAFFLVNLGLSILLSFFCVLEIRQAAKGVTASFEGPAAENLLLRIADRYARLRDPSDGELGMSPETETHVPAIPGKASPPIAAGDLKAMVAGMKLPEGGRLYLIDRQGRSVSDPPADGDQACVREILAVLSPSGGVDAGGTGGATFSGETVGGACGPEGRERAWARPLGEDGLCAVFIVGGGEAMRLSGDGVRRFVWAASALLASCGVLAAVLIRRILRPLWVIGDLAREYLRNGRIDENRYVTGGGEIGTLGAAVYQMTEKLVEHQKTILAGAEARDRLAGDVESLRERTHELFRENEKLRRRFEVIREKQESLRRSEERYRTMLENIEEYFYEADLSGNLLFFNDALYRMLGYAREKLIGMNFREFMDRGTAEKAFRIFRKAYETGQAQKGIGWRLVRKDGSACHIEISVSLIRNLAGEIIGFRGVARNISELIYLVYHDSLTGLYNRKAFFERMRETLAMAKRDQKEKNIFYLDLDEFKRVNDEYGHHVGDEVLKEVAARLKASLRETDHICRIGGDEFVVILSNLKGEPRPEEAARRVLEALSRPYRVHGHEIDFITPSIGISTYPKDSDNVEALIRCADIAMFKAKRKDGGGCYAFYDKRMDEEWRPPDIRRE